MDSPEYRTVRVVIDDDAIKRLDVWDVIDPAWWTADFWHGMDAYRDSVRAFSDHQQLMLSLLVYLSDVKNGGHELYLSAVFSNLYADALRGFLMLDLPACADVLKASIRKLGAQFPTLATERETQIAKQAISFDDCDNDFFRLVNDLKVEDKICLLYTSPSPRDLSTSRMPSSA